GALHSLRKGTQALVAPISAAGDWLFTPLLATRNFFGGLGVSREEIDALRQQNTELRASVAELEEARLENQRLQKIVGFVEAAKLDSLGARVIGRPPSAWEGTLLIDRGAADGVKTGMPVLAPEGLLGQTVEVTEHSAKVRLITDQRSGVAALIQSTRAEGVARGSIEGRLSMEYVSRETTITVGDIILTSGMGGVYPKGLLVGEVASFELNDNDLYPRITVRPTAKFDGIEEVVVLIGAVLQPDLGGTE
ncbi:MAG: rod shape-determining protein MreC, partial [Actinomycetota bacterium]|nr:rod shape-determining protein MreC [Actinomycetota bacterium]